MNCLDVILSCLSTSANLVVNRIGQSLDIAIDRCGNNIAVGIERLCSSLGVNIERYGNNLIANANDVLQNKHLNVTFGIVCNIGEPYLRVSPSEVQWITSDEIIFYDVESNVNWQII